MKNNMKDKNADEMIGTVINEYGEIVRGGGSTEVDNIQFSAPIFTPPEENTPVSKARESVEVDVVIRDPSAEKSKNKKVSQISNLDIEKMKSEFGL